MAFKTCGLQATTLYYAATAALPEILDNSKLVPSIKVLGKGMICKNCPFQDQQYPLLGLSSQCCPGLIGCLYVHGFIGHQYSTVVRLWLNKSLFGESPER